MSLEREQRVKQQYKPTGSWNEETLLQLFMESHASRGQSVDIMIFHYKEQIRTSLQAELCRHPPKKVRSVWLFLSDKARENIKFVHMQLGK